MTSTQPPHRPTISSSRPLRQCQYPGCPKAAKAGGVCIAHGGGKRCGVDGCRTSVVSRGRCVAHGGGRRCQTTGCVKSAQTGGFCWVHGGGKKCGRDGCKKRARSGGACIAHGGGKRCTVEDCNKVVQYAGLCVRHGGYRRCRFQQCTRRALPNSYCHVHSGSVRCQYVCEKTAAQGGYCSQHLPIVSHSTGSATLTHVVSPCGEHSPTQQTQMPGRNQTASPIDSPSRWDGDSLQQQWGQSSPVEQSDVHFGDRTHRNTHRNRSETRPAPLQLRLPDQERCRLPPLEPSTPELMRDYPFMSIHDSYHFDRREQPPHLSVGAGLRRSWPYTAVGSYDTSPPRHRSTSLSIELRSPGQFELRRRCEVMACVRFAKIDGRCLLHL